MVDANLRWKGFLTMENAPEVARRLRLLLSDKRFMFISSNRSLPFTLHGRGNQKLSFDAKKAIQVRRHKTKGYASLRISCTHGVWICNTQLMNEEDAADIKKGRVFFTFTEKEVTIVLSAVDAYYIEVCFSVECDGGVNETKTSEFIMDEVEDRVDPSTC